MAKRDLNPAETILARWAAEAANGSSLPDFDPEFSASFPNLWVFLTWSEVGQFSKAPGKVSIAAEGTGWKISYYDPSAKRGTAVVSGTLMEGLKKLDAALVSGDTVWSGGGTRNKGFKKRET